MSSSYGFCFILSRMTSQKASASAHESVSAIEPAIDLPSAEFARS